MGFATPAALGAQIARRDHRALVLVGDGAFQMTGTELSTAARLKLNPIVVIFNNKGYSTERYILEGPFNDIAAWNFDRIGELFGPIDGYGVRTEDEFESAFTRALATKDRPSVLNVHLRSDDPSPAMRRLAEHLRAIVSGG
jgi:indolepyruvate decarboxylase